MATVEQAATTDHTRARSQAAEIALRDVHRLHQLGYTQELRRRMSWFSNFAVSFSIISILTALTLYGYGMGTGGPADLVWGYLVVGLLVIVVGAGMAEICSSYPTSGGLYYWAGRLGEVGAGLELVHRVVQRARPGGRHGRDRLRFRHLLPRLLEPHDRWAVTSHNQLLVYGLSGDGATITDIEGRTYIDGLSGMWNVNVGHGVRGLLNGPGHRAGRTTQAADLPVNRGLLRHHRRR